MPDITSQLDLHFLKHAGKGFVTEAELNGRLKLHRVNCHDIDTIDSNLARLKFFETRPEAMQWLKDKNKDWFTCKTCAT
jgi:hypothetical protein